MSMSGIRAAPQPAIESASRKELLSLREIVDEAAHLLPEQAPLHAFVHHNTLHAFEHLSFESAVVEAASILGTEPFQTESAFAGHLDTGRIQPQDIDAVVADTTSGDDRPLFPSGPTRAEFRRLRLKTLFEIPHGYALRFLLLERDVSARFHPSVLDRRRREILGVAVGTHDRSRPSRNEAGALRELWEDLKSAAPNHSNESKSGTRRRDDLLEAISIDTDELVHPLLIRLCAAFLDQGIAYWSMPYRSKGFLSAVRRLYGLSVPPPDRALRGLARELNRQEREQWTAEQTVIWALAELDVKSNRCPTYINETLLALRGWAGMMRHLEVRPDRAPVESPPASLMDFLAVRLVFDAIAARNLLSERFGSRATFEALRETQREASPLDLEPDGQPCLELVFEAFVFAQHSSIEFATLHATQNARVWLEEVQAFDETERRRCLHLAYERRHRVEVLDGINAHCRVSKPKPPSPKFQASFCIDDREESLRRHLEECFPAVETYGYAGFFGAAMNYQGLEDVRPRPLCPVTIQPKHLIYEKAENSTDEKLYRNKRRWLGLATHALSVASKTLIRGGLSVLLGTVALIPLVLRSLFPRFAEAWMHALEHRVAPQPRTRLLLERSTDSGEVPHRGYTIGEMTMIVDAALRTMSIVDDFCSLVLMVGHGSSSLNNPHEAAHDCGATGGGRGGPNARAFAVMANHPEVRKQLSQTGIDIPSSTWFVGAYHNTCDDTMIYYDEDLVPASHSEELNAIKKAMADACRLNAHERCRRFETAPARLSVDRSMHYARIHAGDLAEPRPEYGHATNAVCIVGRRDRTRGLFLDRRAFLVSYDPDPDPAGELLASLLLSVGPVGAGINLEYYFSFVDPVGYGSGTKLPHNITGLIGVMDGHATDLRTGLPWQMVEIHEPVRLLTIVEAKQVVLERILAREAGLAQLVQNGWIQLVAWDPDSERMSVFHHGGFKEYQIESDQIPAVHRSVEHYGGHREHLPPAHVMGAFGGPSI